MSTTPKQNMLFVDPELCQPIDSFAAAIGDTCLDLSDLTGARNVGQAMAEAAQAEMSENLNVTIEHEVFFDQQFEINVEIETYRPKSASGKLPIILFIHGGGYVLGAADQARQKLTDWAEKLGVYIASVNYRLAPEHPFPAALFDCFCTLKWLISNANQLNIDSTRIALVGESAGGGLAAGLCHYLRDHTDIKIALQLLLYPMIDHQNIVPASDKQSDTYVWSRANNAFGWKSYLAGGVNESMLSYAVPTTRIDHIGLPRTSVHVGDLDLFYQENQQYVDDLLDAGVNAQLISYPGCYHAFNAIAADAEISKQFESDLLTTIRACL
ncbi:MAG: acetyl esterase [Pseudoalteromonas tetraodonis]|jgi:acetyl esterase